MTATQLVEMSLDYIVTFSPYLAIFMALAFAQKIIDLIYTALENRKRKGW